MSTAAQWRQVEVAFSGPAVDRPYVEVEAWVELVHDDGTRLVRPLFWDGATTWRLRFSSPLPHGRWTWTVAGPDADRLTPTAGTFDAAPAQTGHAHPGLVHGFPRLSPEGRSLVHPDGRDWFMVVDTAWAMPWRAGVEDVEAYARDRAAKGFDAVLLMSVQPDMRAVGPDARGVDEGFAVGFRDLPDGRLTDLVPDYFAHLDLLVEVLLRHGITPVLQPLFFGFGWKGLDVAGPVVPPDELARYARYLVARYGAQPVVWLPGADGAGDEPGIEAAGREIEAWDAYEHPTGIHYRPHHRNDVHQDAPWLDFQACQTGHGGDHVPDRVATMWAARPVKAVMNLEPTYEHTGRPGVAEGWWQGHEAWSNLCAGALLGVAYGAASLWQWRLHPGEPGHAPFFLAADAGWREALDFEGSRYVGLVGRILEGLPLRGAAPCWDVGLTARGLLDPGVLYLAYAEHGGPFVLLDGEGRVPGRWWLVDPRDGSVLGSGATPPDGTPIEHAYDQPAVLICVAEEPAIARRAAE
ncbi:apiosidase-like domain-containing protein [Microlunatus flavus]|uniref:Collagen-binding domain of a collagenase n=1 Tax=Microlunatus flavus TaxID=1036181 RepID=A0A1H8ZY93_9ACTN|nr:DUF4038 domain-containing protein [Microlunatus flavus]SEP69227.1 protein of unknown function [Microlunatus flavus]